MKCLGASWQWPWLLCVQLADLCWQGVSDGAAAVLIASEDALKQHKLTPLARIVAYHVSGCDPSIMGIGKWPALWWSSVFNHYCFSELVLFTGMLQGWGSLWFPAYNDHVASAGLRSAGRTKNMTKDQQDPLKDWNDSDDDNIISLLLRGAKMYLLIEKFLTILCNVCNIKC